MRKIKHYLSLIAFTHSIFALPFACIGFFYAVHQGYHATAYLFLKVLLCMVLARSIAMAFNRWVDADIDGLNPRTQTREIPQGLLSKSTLLILILLQILIFCMTTYFINMPCLLLSPLALLVVMGYSYTKRFTFFAHLFLGLGLALAPLGSYIAVSGVFNQIPILLGLAVLLWVSGFDIIYALQDEEFDRTHQLHSIPSFFGAKKALLIARGLHLASVSIFILVGLCAHWHGFYFCGCGFFGITMYLQHRRVDLRNLSHINRQFFMFNGIASIVFCAFTLLDFYFN